MTTTTTAPRECAKAARLAEPEGFARPGALPEEAATPGTHHALDDVRPRPEGPDMTLEHARRGAAEVRRQADTIAAHFRRHGKAGTKAPVTRTMEFAFETSCAHSDAVAAILMRRAARSPALRRGLDAWAVFEDASWLGSQARHAGRTEAAIVAAAYPGG